MLKVWPVENVDLVIWLEDESGKLIEHVNIEELSARIVNELKNGKIIALRALGGFQFICDARNPKAISKLRMKKKRPSQSFALMASNLENIQRECLVDAQAEKLLISEVSPILILELNNKTTLPLDLIAPDLYTVGVMMPTTPLHQLLFGLEKNVFDFLVVTSGNAHGEPIAFSNQEARSTLSSIADLFLMHDRDILRRVDDSIATICDGQVQYWRHGRSLAPMRFKSSTIINKNILALGPEFKNTVTLSYDETLITSPHLGTLDNSSAVKAFMDICDDFPNFYQKKLDAIVVDKHPDYFSSKFGRQLAIKLNIPCIEVQHHHAHAKAVMAEHQLSNAVAIIFDGTGFGDDGTLWGGELLNIKNSHCTRIGHLKPFPLVGGSSAITSPWKTAIPFCDSMSDQECATLFLQEPEKIQTIRSALKKNINAPLTSSMGRLFDAVSAILEIAPLHTSYEAQAAIKMEKSARYSKQEKIPLRYKSINSEGKITIEVKEIIDNLLELKKNNIQTNDLAFRFHFTVATIIRDFVLFARRDLSLQSENIVLSGGVFQNRLLVSLAMDLLRDHQCIPYISKLYSPGDGQISMGQAIIARETFSYI